VTLAELPSAIGRDDIAAYLSPDTKIELSVLPGLLLEIIGARGDDKHVVDGVVNELRRREEAK
jgi:hypothetical protein